MRRSPRWSLVSRCTPAWRSAGAASHGQLVITSEPAGAEVSIDGQHFGRAPFVVRNLVPAEHLIEAMWPDGRTSTSTERVVAGQSRMVKLSPTVTAPEPPPPAPPPPTPQQPPLPEPPPLPPPPAPIVTPPPPPIVTPPPPSPAPATPPKPDLPPSARPRRFYKSALFWTSLVVAASAIVAVGVGAGIAADQRSRYALVQF